MLPTKNKSKATGQLEANGIKCWMKLKEAERFDIWTAKITQTATFYSSKVSSRFGFDEKFQNKSRNLLGFRGDVVPLHVLDQSRHGGHALMLVQLVHL